MNWYDIIKATPIRESEAMLLARKLVMPYLQVKIREIPLETLTLPLEGQSATWGERHNQTGGGRRVTGHFFNDVEVNRWLGEPDCKSLFFANEEWTTLAGPEMKRGAVPYPYNQDPVLDGGQCNIQSAEFVMQAIVQRLPQHKITIDVEPLGWQGTDALTTRIEPKEEVESHQRSYQCGFKYRYIPDEQSRVKGVLGTGKVTPKKDEDTTLW